MKWGVRRFQNEDGSLTPKGLKRQNKINKEAAKYENKAFKAELHGNIKAADTYSEIASKLKKQDLTHKTYDEIKRRSNLKVAAATVAGLLGGALLTTSVARYLNRNKPASSTDHGYIAEQIALGTLFCGEIGFVTSRAANSSSNALKRYNKQFASSSDKKDSVKHSDIYTEEFYHSGIKGMKWGIRRYQNEDGTLTDAGKVRYNPDGSKKRVEKMSDAELNKANQRLSAEQNYNRLTGKYYKNRPASTDIALKAGVSALGGALLSSGAYIIRDVAKNPGTKLGKEYFKSDKMKTATALGVLGATIASISSVVTSLGGQASVQNIGDQSKKKG
jgi:hypothetical protein